MTDSELLSAHLRGDPHAFAALVQRHLDLVHGVAARQAPASADDVAQAVFLLLNRKAPQLKSRASVAGWLFRTAQLCARNARRDEVRRKSHEREAAMHSAPMDDHDASLLPHLDDAIGSLSAADRELILLRHLQNRELANIAANLGITVPAATKRLQRAIDKLRSWFSRRGESVSASGMTSALVAAASHHAPATLQIAPGSASATAAALAKSAALSLATPALSAVAAIALVVCVAATTAAIIAHHHATVSATTPVSVPASAPALADESAIAGKPMIASFDVLLDTDVADALRAAATEVPSASKGYTVYRITNSNFSGILRPALDAGQILPGDYVNYDSGQDPGTSTMSYVHFNTQFQGRLQGAFISGLSESGDPQFLSLKWLGDAVDITANALTFKINTQDAASNWKQFAGEVSLHTMLSPGESLCFLRDAGGPAGQPLSHLLVWQSFKALPDQADRIRSIRTAATLIAAGPAGARGIADRYLQWSHDAKSADSLVPAKFSHTFPNGASVRLLAIGHPRDVPFCWWSADGTPVSGDWTGLDISPEVSRAFVLQWSAPLTAQPPAYSNWYTNGAAATRYYLAAHGDFAHPLPDNASSIDIGISAGPWKEIGTMPPIDLFQQGDVTVEVKKIMPIFDGKGAMPVVHFKSPLDTDIRILVVDSAGKRYFGNHDTDVDADWPGIHFALPPKDQWQHLSPNVNIAPDKIDHLIVERRHIDWTRFEDFADQPATAVPDQANSARITEIRAQITRQAADEHAAQAAKHRDEVQKRFHAADPSTPVGTMAAIILRARAGDLPGTRALFLTANPDEAAVADQAARFLVAHESLRIAAEKRFGELAADDALLPNDLLEDFDLELDQKWTIDGDHASIGPGGLPMQKRDGHWLIDTAPLLAGGSSLVIEAPIFEQIHQQLDRGDFPTAAATAKALQYALKPPAPASTQTAK